MDSSAFLLGVQIKSFNNFFVFINYVYYMEVTDRSSGLINVIIVKAKKIFEDIFARDSRVGGGGGANISALQNCREMVLY